MLCPTRANETSYTTETVQYMNIYVFLSSVTASPGVLGAEQEHSSFLLRDVLYRIMKQIPDRKIQTAFQGKNNCSKT